MRMRKTKCRTKAYKGSHAMVRMAGEKVYKTLSFLTVTCNEMKCGTRRAFGTSGKAGSCKHWLVKVFYISAHSFEKCGIQQLIETREFMARFGHL